jgi:antitoxin (DNA-binding transcriptional repressor) of toxin-antitoxin stability system
MKQMPAGEFKTHRLAAMDDVNTSAEPEVITKRGKPIAKLVPAVSKSKILFGFMAGEFKIVGDIEAPIVPS